MATVDVGTGTTIAFGTSSFTANIRSISADGISRAVIDKTHMGSTTSMRKRPGKLVDPGELTVEFELDPDAQPPIAGAPETITITFPIPTGSTNGATLAGEGFVSEWSWNDPLEDDMTASMTIVWTGATGPAWTDAS